MGDDKSTQDPIQIIPMPESYQWQLSETTPILCKDNWHIWGNNAGTSKTCIFKNNQDRIEGSNIYRQKQQKETKEETEEE